MQGQDAIALLDEKQLRWFFVKKNWIQTKAIAFRSVLCFYG